MKKLKTRISASLFSLITLGGSYLPTAFANPGFSEGISSNPITQFEKSSKPPRKPCEKRRKVIDDLLKYYDRLTNYDAKLVNWERICTGKMPDGAIKYINDIDDLTGACDYVRYILSKDSISNKFKNIETEIKNSRLNNPQFLDGQFLNKICGSIYGLDGFKLSAMVCNIVRDITGNGIILDFSREKCKSVNDYITMFTSDKIPELIPMIIDLVKTKAPYIGKINLMMIGRSLYRTLFRTMIYRLCIDEI